MAHSPHQNTPDPEDYIPSFRRRNLDTSGFMKKTRTLCRPPGQTCRPPAVCALLSLGIRTYTQTRQNDYCRRTGLLPQPY